jgi:hypothetical protein
MQADAAHLFEQLIVANGLPPVGHSREKTRLKRREKTA